MKKSFIAISAMINVFFFIGLVIQNWSPLDDRGPNIVTIVNNSGGILTDFRCNYLETSVRLDSMFKQQAIELQFYSFHDSHIEMQWTFMDSTVSVDYGYYTSYLSSTEKVEITRDFQVKLILEESHREK